MIWMKRAALVTGLLLLAAAWRWTSLEDYATVEKVAELARSVQHSPAAPMIVVATYALLGLVVFPVTVLIAATALVFEPVISIVYALAGSMASGLLVYKVGHWFGKDVRAHVEAGGRLHRTLRQLNRRGLMAVILIRIIPVAPYTVTNIIAGALRISFRDFFWGTLIGVTPGIIIISLLVNQAKTVWFKPDPVHGAALAGGLAVVILGVAPVKRHLLKKYGKGANGASSKKDGLHS